MTDPSLEDYATPTKLGELSGKHICIKCLRPVRKEEYLSNDHLCDHCNNEEGGLWTLGERSGRNT